MWNSVCFVVLCKWLGVLKRGNEMIKCDDLIKLGYKFRTNDEVKKSEDKAPKKDWIIKSFSDFE